MNTLPQDYEATITQITQRLSAAHLQIIRTFDLKSACADQPGGLCPHHGTALCDCQMTVLLVYCPSRASVTLTIRQCDDQIQFSMVHPSSQQPDPQLETIILQALTFDHVLWDFLWKAPDMDHGNRLTTKDRQETIENIAPPMRLE